MIQVTNLTKRYNLGTMVLNIPSLEIPKGQSFGLVGNNGAGKTTFFSLLLDLIQPIKEKETVDLHHGFNRILARAISSELDFPYWDNSAMDGYAVRYTDVQTIPVSLTVVTEIPAGKIPQKNNRIG
jgi:ABC-type polysaccharide/polyol phosphate transport system ATPase subunit